MRYLKLISYLITLAGIVAVAAALALDLDRTVVLVGMMLVIAGVVKIATVGIWHGFAGFGVPLTDADSVGAQGTAVAPEEVRR